MINIIVKKFLNVTLWILILLYTILYEYFNDLECSSSFIALNAENFRKWEFKIARKSIYSSHLFFDIPIKLLFYSFC